MAANPRRPPQWLAGATDLLTVSPAAFMRALRQLTARRRRASVRRQPPSSWRDDAITIAYLGHATLLINFMGVRVLSDPVFFKRIGLALDHLATLGPARYVPCALRPAVIPRTDAILLTHAHLDHLDVPSLRVLPKDSAVVVARRCEDLVAPLGFTDVRPLRWHQGTTVAGLRITALGARHWGKRWPWEAPRGYNSYLLEKDGVRMLLACDSGDTHAFASLRRDPPLIAAFSVGSYDPWIRTHATPEQVWKMFQSTGARYLVPIHWGTFSLSREPMDEPMRRLMAAAGRDSSRIAIRRIGGLLEVVPDSEQAPGKSGSGETAPAG